MPPDSPNDRDFSTDTNTNASIIDEEPMKPAGVVLKPLNPQTPGFTPFGNTTMTPPLFEPTSNSIPPLYSTAMTSTSRLLQQHLATLREMNGMVEYGHFPLQQQDPPPSVPELQYSKQPFSFYELNGTTFFQYSETNPRNLTATYADHPLPAQQAARSVSIHEIDDSELPPGVSSYVKNGQTYFNYELRSLDGDPKDRSPTLEGDLLACSSHLSEPENIKIINNTQGTKVLNLTLQLDQAEHEHYEEYNRRTEVADEEYDRQDMFHKTYHGVHHVNWLGCPVYSKTFTPANVSLVVIRTAPKYLLCNVPEFSLDKWIMLRNALALVDPVIYWGPLDVLRRLKGSELQQAVTGCVRNFYSGCGSWYRDYEGHIDEMPLHDSMQVTSYAPTDAIFNGWYDNHDVLTRREYDEASELAYNTSKSAINKAVSDRREKGVRMSPLSQVAYTIYPVLRRQTKLQVSSADPALIPTPLNIQKASPNDSGLSVDDLEGSGSSPQRSSKTLDEEIAALIDSRSDSGIDEEGADLYGPASLTMSANTSISKTSPTVETFEKAANLNMVGEFLADESILSAESFSPILLPTTQFTLPRQPKLIYEAVAPPTTVAASALSPNSRPLVLDLPKEFLKHSGDEVENKSRAEQVSPSHLLTSSNSIEFAVEDELTVSSDSPGFLLLPSFSNLALSGKLAVDVDDNSILSSMSRESVLPISLSDMNERPELAVGDDPAISSESADLMLPAYVSNLTLSPRFSVEATRISTSQAPGPAFDRSSPKSAQEAFFTPSPRSPGNMHLSSRILHSSPSKEADSDKVPVLRLISQSPWSTVSSDIPEKHEFVSGFPDFDATPIPFPLTPTLRAARLSVTRSVSTVNPFGDLQDIPQEPSAEAPALKRILANPVVLSKSTSKLPMPIPMPNLVPKRLSSQVSDKAHNLSDIEEESEDEQQEAGKSSPNNNSESDGDSIIRHDLLDGSDNVDSLESLAEHFDDAVVDKLPWLKPYQLHPQKSLPRSEKNFNLKKLADAFEEQELLSPGQANEQSAYELSLSKLPYERPGGGILKAAASMEEKPSKTVSIIDPPIWHQYDVRTSEPTTPSGVQFPSNEVLYVPLERMSIPQEEMDCLVAIDAEGGDPEATVAALLAFPQNFQAQAFAPELESTSPAGLEPTSEQESTVGELTKQDITELLPNIQPQIPALEFSDASAMVLEPFLALPVFKRTRPSLGQKVWSKITSKLRKKQPMASLVITNNTSKPKNKVIGSARKFFTQEINVLA